MLNKRKRMVKSKKMSMRSMLQRNATKTQEPLIKDEPIKVNSIPVMSVGEVSQEVVDLQRMLNDLVEIYPTIPVLLIDGVYNDKTKIAVEEFQNVAGLAKTGTIDTETLERIYSFHSKKDALINRGTALSRDDMQDGLDLSNNIVHEGSKGHYVVELQKYVNKLSQKYSSINQLVVDGVFGSKTKSAVQEFQRLMKLTPDGIVGDETWNKIFYETIGM